MWWKKKWIAQRKERMREREKFELREREHIKRRKPQQDSAAKCCKMADMFAS